MGGERTVDTREPLAGSCMRPSWGWGTCSGGVCPRAGTEPVAYRSVGHGSHHRATPARRPRWGFVMPATHGSGRSAREDGGGGAGSRERAQKSGTDLYLWGLLVWGHTIHGAPQHPMPHQRALHQATRGAADRQAGNEDKTPPGTSVRRKSPRWCGSVDRALACGLQGPELGLWA